MLAVRLLPGLVALVMLAEPARAQEDPTLARGREFDAAAAPAPAVGSRRYRARLESHGLPRDDADRAHPLAFAAYATAGESGSSGTRDMLTAHGFGDATPTLGVQAWLTHRLFIDQLYVGGAFGTQGMGWGRRDGEIAMASTIDLLAVLHLRFQLGSWVDLGAFIAGGLGYAFFELRGSATGAIVPRVEGGLLLGLRVTTGVRLFLRGGYGWAELGGAYETAWSGVSGGLGFEVRS